LNALLGRSWVSGRVGAGWSCAGARLAGGAKKSEKG
jgi:hypothetical protein